jgi:hypothetical protein
MPAVREHKPDAYGEGFSRSDCGSVCDDGGDGLWRAAQKLSRSVLKKSEKEK